MSIFFPDNEKRQARLLELSTDTQNFLHDAKTDYEKFKSLNTQVNEKIARVYEKAGLTPPKTTTLDILKAAGATHDVKTGDTAVEITDIFVDVAGLVATVQYLAPGATAFLVETGAMEAETAAAVMGTVLGTEITAGALAGGILSGILGGVVIVGIGLAIDAIEGSILRDKLRDGIHKMDQVRASTKLSLDKAKKLLGILESAKRTLDALISSNVTLSDQLIRNLIVKDATPAIDAANSITMSTVIVELDKLDYSRHSWTVEDIVPHDTFPVKPIKEENITYNFLVNVLSGSLKGKKFKGSFSYDPSVLKGKGEETIKVLEAEFNYLSKYTESPKISFTDGNFERLIWVSGKSTERFGFNAGFERTQFGRTEEAFIRNGKDYFAYLNKRNFVDGAGTITYMIA